ncbi:MAG: lipocalin family protein [Haliscomenobacter sp.]|uniref:lipocalin family protein n=1 Tax=Haliscomenobacter sp. TaxID=2717303 RepID=UPI0029A0EEB8|nr:lipocalin family protein [Haliscomenobacter sp.]MDX2068134.1 lipocalin family protein [Haliscomenobacter sp.]
MYKSFASPVLIGMLCLLLGCSPYRQRDLIGEWQAVVISQEGDSLLIDPKVVQFTFNKNEGYTFKSTLNYQESGTYYILNKRLFTIDTLNRASTEKSVEILLLTPDSLHLKMSDAGKGRMMKLVKQK